MAPRTPITAIAIVGTHELQVAVAEAAKLIPALVMNVEVVRADTALERAEARADAADILIVDLPLDDLAAPGRVAQLVARRPHRLTVISADGIGMNHVRRLHRVGVYDVLPQPAEIDDVVATLSAAVRHIADERRDASGLAPVIAFTRAKGGMGATTLATHTMLSLAGVGRRKPVRRSVGFLDLDLQFGDAAINLDLPASPGLLGVLHDPGRLDGALLRSSMVERPEGFSMLAAPRELLPLDALEPETAGRLIDIAREEFDVVVLDLPIAVTGWTHAVLERVQELVVVTVLSVGGIRRTRRLAELLEQEPIGTMTVSMALNRFADRFGERSIVRQSEKTLGRPFDFRIANDYKTVARSHDSGMSLFELLPRGRLSRDIHQMADALVARAQSREAESAAPENTLLAAE